MVAHVKPASIKRRITREQSRERLRAIVRLWPTHSGYEIADELGIAASDVYRYTSMLRRAGIVLPKHERRGGSWSLPILTGDLLDELRAELARALEAADG